MVVPRMLSPCIHFKMYCAGLWDPQYAASLMCAKMMRLWTLACQLAIWMPCCLPCLKPRSQILFSQVLLLLIISSREAHTAAQRPFTSLLGECELMASEM